MRKGYSNKLRHVQRTHKINLGVVTDAIEDGVLLEHVQTDRQSADVFTKDLPPAKWQFALDMIGIVPDSASLPLSDLPARDEPSPDPNFDPSDTPDQGGEVSSDPSLLGGASAACYIIDDAVADLHNDGEVLSGPLSADVKSALTACLLYTSPSPRDS